MTSSHSKASAGGASLLQPTDDRVVCRNDARGCTETNTLHALSYRHPSQGGGNGGSVGAGAATAAAAAAMLAPAQPATFGNGAGDNDDGFCEVGDGISPTSRPNTTSCSASLFGTAFGTAATATTVATDIESSSSKRARIDEGSIGGGSTAGAGDGAATSWSSAAFLAAAGAGSLLDSGSATAAKDPQSPAPHQIRPGRAFAADAVLPMVLQGPNPIQSMVAQAHAMLAAQNKASVKMLNALLASSATKRLEAQTAFAAAVQSAAQQAEDRLAHCHAATVEQLQADHLQQIELVRRQEAAKFERQKTAWQQQQQQQQQQRQIAAQGQVQQQIGANAQIQQQQQQQQPPQQQIVAEQPQRQQPQQGAVEPQQVAVVAAAVQVQEKETVAKVQKGSANLLQVGLSGTTAVNAHFFPHGISQGC